MKQFIKQYHGATIYEVSEMKDSDGIPLDHKIVAKGTLPGLENFNVDFVEIAGNRETAIDKIQQDIDLYLKEHDIEAFSSKEMEQ